MPSLAILCVWIGVFCVLFYASSLLWFVGFIALIATGFRATAWILSNPSVRFHCKITEESKTAE